MDHETVVRGVARDIQMDSFIDDLSSIASKGLSHHDCRGPFHVDNTSGSMHQQHTPRQATTSGKAINTTRERKREGERGQSEGREKGREERESVRKGERGKKEEGRDAEEEECKQVKKDVTGWTVVTRHKRQRRTIQIFVKVDEGKVTPMEVSLTDGKVEDVMRQVQRDEDVYVTMHGKVLRRNEKLKSCGVTDGCTIQATSRMRGGGRQKDKSSKSEKKRTTKSERPEQKSNEDPEMITMDEAMRRLEEDEVYQKNIECMSEGSEGEVQQTVQNYLAQMQKVSWMNKVQHELLESGVWRAVEARRKGRGQEQEQRRQEEPEQRRQHEQEQREQPEEKERRQEQGEQRRLAAQEHNTGQEQSKQGKGVRFGEEEELGETRAESTDEPEVTGGTTEVRTGRGSAGLVRGGDERRWTDETTRKGKGKG